MLFLHLLDGTNSSPQISELDELLLDDLQPFVPLAVSELGLCVVSAFTSIMAIRLLKLCDLGAEPTNLYAKHFEVIHTLRVPSAASDANLTIDLGVPLRDDWIRWTLNKPSLKFNDWSVCSRWRTPDHSAQAISPLRIDGTMKGKRIAHGLGCGRAMASVADRSRPHSNSVR